MTDNSNGPNPWFGVGTIVAVIIIVVTGFMLIQPPWEPKLPSKPSSITLPRQLPKDFHPIADSECYEVPETPTEADGDEKGWQRANIVDRKTLFQRQSKGEVVLKVKTIECFEYYSPGYGQLDYRLKRYRQVWFRELNKGPRIEKAIVTF